MIKINLNMLNLNKSEDILPSLPSAWISGFWIRSTKTNMASMLRWLYCARQGKAPRRLSQTSDKVTEAKKVWGQWVREFKNHLTNGHPWLKYDTSVQIMFCNYCTARSREKVGNLWVGVKISELTPSKHTKWEHLI